jgi:hypothetical protein
VKQACNSGGEAWGECLTILAKLAYPFGGGRGGLGGRGARVLEGAGGGDAVSGKTCNGERSDRNQESEFQSIHLVALREQLEVKEVR